MEDRTGLFETIEAGWQELAQGKRDRELQELYLCEEAEIGRYRERMLRLRNTFHETFADKKQGNGEKRHVREPFLFSVPGRTELGGNHTDHQNGKVLAAAISLDLLGAAAANGTRTIRLCSEGYPMELVDLDDLKPRPSEENTSTSLIRGTAARFQELGWPVMGFDAVLTSEVLPGSGLSSSAAYEVMLGNMINGLFCEGAVSAVEIAGIGQYTENVYFGKPSGLMDQMACSVGAVTEMDFRRPDSPQVERVDFDFDRCGYGLCMIDIGADHAELTREYAAIPQEMNRVARLFGEEVLREISEEDFLDRISEVREAVGDRGVLRALHFFEENRRVAEQGEALRREEFEQFLQLVNESGRSSWLLLQNVTVSGNVREQSAAVVLALCGRLLEERGACRIHGGGFGGTVQAFVPVSALSEFCGELERMLGAGCCHVLSIRQAGGIRLI